MTVGWKKWLGYLGMWQVRLLRKKHLVCLVSEMKWHVPQSYEDHGNVLPLFTTRLFPSFPTPKVLTTLDVIAWIVCLALCIVLSAPDMTYICKLKLCALANHIWCPLEVFMLKKSYFRMIFDFIICNHYLLSWKSPPSYLFSNHNDHLSFWKGFLRT